MSNKTKKIVLIVLVALLIGACAFLTYRHYSTHENTNQTGSSKINDVDYGEATDEQKQEGERIKEQNDPSNSSSDNTSESTSTTITIVRVNQISPGQNVNLRATIDSNVSGGTCVAVFNKPGQTDVKVTSEIAADPTSYSCEPIDVSVAQLGVGGTWNVTAYVQKSGAIVSNKATGSVEVKQ